MSTQQVDVPPIQQLPTAKEKRYDRQLRLWGASGQAALEDAHILLINSGPGVTGTETLKNLILPGIGQFTIQDAALVEEADLGINFFLEEGSLGQPRARQACDYLLELNPDVIGHAVTEPLDTWISSGEVLTPYTLILISSPIRPDILSQITTYSQNNGISMFYMHSVGFYSHFSIILPSAFPIVDTHPDSTATTDLRLLAPWPALARFAKEKTCDLGSLSEIDLGHVPYLLLLLHYIDEWRSSHGGEAPLSYKDKTAFRDTLRAAGPPEEENFGEAAAAVLKTLNLPTPSSSVLSVLQAPETRQLTSDTASFWIIAAAVHDFYQKHEQLPLPGSLPDMKARSADYIALQNIYKSKAREDCAQVTSTVRQLEAQVGRNSQIPDSEIEQFCKLAAHIKLVRGSSTPLALVQDGLSWTAEAGKDLVMKFPNPDFGMDGPTLIYIAFVAYDSFLASHADDMSSALHPPGSNSQHVDSDAEKLTGIALKVLDAAINATGSRVENPQYDDLQVELGKICQEITRAGGGELHNIASLTGGIVSQEIIKVITRQYVPADNTVIFDGITSKTIVLKI
ncbi:NEDD8-activating enzyme E1 regulatory subunit [Sphaceloma murrayae]|uniref:NEDD8-activating enzyme E1 regulatory subunit n=1 Tax=Sphaceloma murrayae TaxID=2082308 RepID=A0A2K1QUM4_9PEZI|nr:NEDD8-activating enzyme E1 regulatory subunit [Sphaceloma murrayae]